MMLPNIPLAKKTQKQIQNTFAGLDRRKAAGNGAISDMANLTGAYAPLLASRPPRYNIGYHAKPNGVFSAGELLLIADGTTLYADGVTAGTVADNEKVWAALGERVLIWPDKLIWSEDDGLQPLESSVTASGLVFSDGTYAGESAEKNTITHPSSGFLWSDYFKVGDAVTVSACAPTGGVDFTPVIREIDGNKLRFYENTFVENGTVGASVTVARTVPDLDFLCTNENRVWGCKGDSIYCCKLGDPYNWNVFDGLSTDSFSVESGTAGDFTGCVSYLGYPCFFKEDRIFKAYGSRPSNFQLMGSATLGVLPGAHKTMAVAGETLYYLSRAGFVAYTGGLPSPVGAALGDTAYTGGTAGSDGLRYFVSARKTNGAELLVYDTRTRQWYREDGMNALQMAYLSGIGLISLTNAGELWMLGEPVSVPMMAMEEYQVNSEAVFADWDYQSFDSKYPVRLWLRAETEQDVTLTVSIRYDGGSWEQVTQWQPGAKKSGYFPVPVRRCERYALKISADGPWKLYELELEYYAGAESRRR